MRDSHSFRGEETLAQPPRALRQRAENVRQNGQVGMAHEHPHAVPKPPHRPQATIVITVFHVPQQNLTFYPRSNPLRINTIEYVNDASEPKMEFVEHELDYEEDTKDGSIHREDVPKVEEKVAAPPRKRQRLNDSNNFNPEVEADSPEALFGKLVGSLLASIQSKKKRSNVMVKIMQILEQSDSDDELL